MSYLLVKAALSAAIIVAVSELARRSAALGALAASLPLISVLAMIWLWRDTHDTARMAEFAQTTFFYVLPSLALFLLMPALLRRGIGFWPALAAGCLLTVVLYIGMAALLARSGTRL
jgi:F0F1-type ATP synthase assembly protein I